MHKRLYLSLIPEALIVSMLEPADFGLYMAVGSRKVSREQAMFIELDPEFRNDFFQIDQAVSDCQPHKDGSPRRSVYVSIYRVLEHIPISAMGDMWLVTRDGRSLNLSKASVPPEFEGHLAGQQQPDAWQQVHLYQELGPVNARVVSVLDPPAFMKYITQDRLRYSIPRLCIAELDLGGLSSDIENGDVSELPYRNIAHIKDCLREIVTRNKLTKTVNRIQPTQIPYRCLTSGLFIGDTGGVAYYGFPSHQLLEREYHSWWRSASEM